MLLFKTVPHTYLLEFKDFESDILKTSICPAFSLISNIC